MSNGIKVKSNGKVVKAKYDAPIIVRFTKDAAERLAACVVLDAAIHGGDANVNATMRVLAHQYCERIEAIAASPEARDGAKVLRKRARS